MAIATVALSGLAMGLGMMRTLLVMTAVAAMLLVAASGPARVSAAVLLVPAPG